MVLLHTSLFLHKLFLLSDRLSIPWCILGELLVILQNPTQIRFLLEAFPEHVISTPTESSAPVSVLVLNCPHSSQHLTQSLIIPCLLFPLLDHQLLREGSSL